MTKSTIIERLHENKFSLIAEIGVNYYDIAKKLNISLMEAAKFMVLAAKNAGIHAVKFQSFTQKTLFAAKEYTKILKLKDDALDGVDNIILKKMQMLPYLPLQSLLKKQVDLVF